MSTCNCIGGSPCPCQRRCNWPYQTVTTTDTAFPSTVSYTYLGLLASRDEEIRTLKARIEALVEEAKCAPLASLTHSLKLKDIRIADLEEKLAKHEERLACPFCSCKVIVTAYEANRFSIACRDCLAGLGGFKSSKEAIEAWNRRAKL